eukprot:3093055-Prymnesium_polylepis.1
MCEARITRNRKIATTRFTQLPGARAGRTGHVRRGPQSARRGHNVRLPPIPPRSLRAFCENDGRSRVARPSDFSPR